MPLNTSKTERAEQAAIDLHDKLLLERRTRTEFTRFFRGVASDLEAFTAETGQAPSVNQYADEVRGLLATADRRTAERFGGSATDFLTEQADNEDDDLIAAFIILAAAVDMTYLQFVDSLKFKVRNATRRFIASEISADTISILNTTQTEIDISIAAARADDVNATRQTVAAAAARDINRTSRARADVIAATVTQKIAEGVKDIEREQFFEARNGFSSVTSGIDQIKEREIWETVGDSHVRDAHVEADGQEKENGFFLVGGEQLRYPGDSAGSPGNTINCRCSAILVID